MSGLSGWCATTAPRHDRDHATCAQRIAAGLLDGCGCADHAADSLVAQGFSGPRHGRMTSAPEGAVNTTSGADHRDLSRRP